MEEIALVPSRSLAACLDAHLARRILLDEAQSKPVDDGQVRRSMSLSNSTVIFPKGDIKAPVKTIFDAPSGLGQLLQTVSHHLASSK